MRHWLRKRPRKRNRSSPSHIKTSKKTKKPSPIESESDQSDQWSDAETVSSESASSVADTCRNENTTSSVLDTCNSVSRTISQSPVTPVVTKPITSMSSTQQNVSLVNQGVASSQVASVCDQTGTIMQNSFVQPPPSQQWVDYGAGFPQQSQQTVQNLPPNINLQAMPMPMSGTMQSMAPPPSPISDIDCLRIATMVKNLLKTEINQLVKQEVQIATNHLTRKIVSLQKSNDDLATQVRDLNGKVDDLEQYGRRMCIRISGIPEMQNENVNNLVMKVAGDIGANVTRHDIDRAHRVGRKDDSNIIGNVGEDDDITDEQAAETAVKTQIKSRDVIVKFTNSNARLEFLKGRKVLREIKSKVFINEDLTATRMKLAFQCRDLKRDRKSSVSKTWVFGGNVYVQDKGGAKYKILTLADLASFTTTNGRSAPAASQGNSSGTPMPV